MDEQKRKETAQRLGCGCAASVFGVFLILMVIGLFLGDPYEPEAVDEPGSAVDVGRPEEPARADWGDPFEPDNPIAPSADEAMLCGDAIEELAQYDYRWNLGLRRRPPDRLSHFERWRWFDAPRGESENPNGSEVRGDNRFLVMEGDVIEFLDSGGGWIRHTYVCTLDVSVHPRVLYDVGAFVGALRPNSPVSQPRPPESPSRYVPPPRPSAPGPVRRPRPR